MMDKRLFRLSLLLLALALVLASLPSSLRAEDKPADSSAAAAATAPGAQAPAAAPANSAAAPVTTIADADNSCIKCHEQLGGKSAEIVAQFKGSVHHDMSFTCTNCHGGDATTMDVKKAKAPGTGFIGKPARATIPELCAKCHSDPKLMKQYGNVRTDQLALYKTSAHGIALYTKGDTNVATCIDCHSPHNILKVDNPKATVYKLNQPQTCAKCHADEKLMAIYGLDPKIADKYMSGEHGKELFERKDLAAPVCADCHGSHGAQPPGVETIQNVCGQCHTQVEKYYNSSKHAQAFAALNLGRCITCHDQHALEKPTEAYFGTGPQGKCILCHSEDSPQHADIATIAKSITDIDGLHSKAAQLVDQTEQTTHLSMFEMIPQVETINTKLLTARSMQHSADVKAMQANLKEANDQYSVIEKFTLKLLERAKFNKMMVVLLAALLIGFGLFMFVYRRMVLDQTHPWVAYEGPSADSVDKGEDSQGRD